MQWALRESERAKVPEYADKWLRFILGSRENTYLESPSEISGDVEWIYKESHLTPAKQIVVANGMPEYEDVIRRASGNPKHPSDENLTRDIESGIQGRIYSKRTADIARVVASSDVNAVIEQVRNRVNGVLGMFMSSVASAPRSRFATMTRWMTTANSQVGLIADGGWLAASDFFDGACGVSINDDLKRYQAFLKRGVYSLVAFRNMTLVLNAPREIHVNEDYRLHSISKPAVVWRDGNKSYFLHGVRFPEDIWTAVKDRKMPAANVIGLRNIEQRTVALRILGYDRVLEELGAKVIDKKDVVSQWNGRKLHYEVVEADLQDDRPFTNARFVKVQCPSTGKATLLRVDPTVGTATVDGAISWTFGMKPSEYNPEVET